jgi:hypothetical protein
MNCFFKKLKHVTTTHTFPCTIGAQHVISKKLKGILSHDHIRRTTYQPQLVTHEPSRFVVSERNWEHQIEEPIMVSSKQDANRARKGPIKAYRVNRNDIAGIRPGCAANLSENRSEMGGNLEATRSRAPRPSNQKTHTKTHLNGEPNCHG